MINHPMKIFSTEMPSCKTFRKFSTVHKSDWINFEIVQLAIKTYSQRVFITVLSIRALYSVAHTPSGTADLINKKRLNCNFFIC